jgi:hypothetical protein
MADFDETAIRSPREAIASITTDEIRPWMVWTAAGCIGGMALLGVVFGIRGAHPGSGVGLGLTPGVAVASHDAAPALALPKDQQWSTLSGPAVKPPPSAAPTKVASAAEADADNETDDQSQSAASEESDAKLIQPPPVRAAPANPPPATTSSAPAGPPSADSSGGLW